MRPPAIAISPELDRSSASSMAALATAAAIDEEAATSLNEERVWWDAWRAVRCRVSHRALLAHYADYPRVIAATCYGRRFHNDVGFEEYFQLAHVGMLEAIEHFDPGFGVQFKTYASRRMHGAIFDGLDHATEKNQQIAALRRLRAQRRESLTAADEDSEVASNASRRPRTPEQLLTFICDVGIGLAIAWLLEDTGMVDREGQSEQLPFYRSTEMRQLRERLHALVQALPAPQAKVITRHYLQNRPFEEIAASMQLTKGRISQIHKQALLALRQAIQSQSPRDVCI